MSNSGHYPSTPDARYFVVKGRLWRTSNPDLAPDTRQALVEQLMTARRQVGLALKAGDIEAERSARAAVDEAKRSLGERGPVWWTDGAPDFNRHMVKNTPYADWYAALAPDSKRLPPSGASGEPRMTSRNARSTGESSLRRYRTLSSISRSQSESSGR